MESQQLLHELWKAALSAVDPETLVSEFFRSGKLDRPSGRIGVFASGKAAAGMAAGVPRKRFHDALIVVPRGSRVLPRLRRFTRFASHPDPDRSSLAAAKAALRFFRGFEEGDLVLALVSGGTSSLLCLPRRGVTLAEKRRRIRRAMEEGWPIQPINRLRTTLSLVKGGRLADATRARVVTLVLSDVPEEDFRIVGSGPTVSSRKPRDRTWLLAGNRTGLEAAARFARSRGLSARIERVSLSGEAAAQGRAFAARLRARRSPRVLLAGGETTVRRASRSGTGGRSQEFALAAAQELAGSAPGLLSCGSDGIDGNSINAGAFADGTTVERARKLRLSAPDFLLRHDSAAFFDALGDRFRPGITGTNVADWVFGIR